MSRETIEWLNTNTLIGFTEKRGQAWHYREGSDNHYSGAVPVEEVQRRLFDWTAEERPLHILSQDGPHFEIPNRKAVVRSDNGHVMGIFADGYQPHQYGEWLLTNVAGILDDKLSIGSAGLLKGGAVAWVSVEIPDTITTPEGVEFRPNLLATTSFDGSLATTYKQVFTNVVCDNTMTMALGEIGPTAKVRHSKKSMGKLSVMRDALGLVYTMADDFAAEVKALCAMEFTDRQFSQLTEIVAPYPASAADSGAPFMKPNAGTQRAMTRADNKRDELFDMWRGDYRVSPWRGTAYGAWQALNTYSHHQGSIRGGNRPERNMLRAADGSTEKADREAVSAIVALTA